MQRIDPARRFAAVAGEVARIAGARTALFCQRRSMGIGFARAFMTPRHVEASGLEPLVFWRQLEAGCAHATADALIATQHWAVLHFRRGSATFDDASLDDAATDIGCTAPVAA